MLAVIGYTVKYGTPYLFTSANPKHTLPSDIILRLTTFFQPILPLSGPCNAPWFSSETWALYKSLTYLHAVYAHSIRYVIYTLTSTSAFIQWMWIIICSKSIKEKHCLHTPYRSKFTVESHGFSATAQLLSFTGVDFLLTENLLSGMTAYRPSLS